MVVLWIPRTLSGCAPSPGPVVFVSWDSDLGHARFDFLARSWVLGREVHSFVLEEVVPVTVLLVFSVVLCGPVRELLPESSTLRWAVLPSAGPCQVGRLLFSFEFVTQLLRRRYILVSNRLVWRVRF